MSIVQRLYPTPRQVSGMTAWMHYRRFVRNLAVGYSRGWRGHRAGYLVPATKTTPAHVKHRGQVMAITTGRPDGPSMFTDPVGFLTHEQTHPRIMYTPPMASNRAGFSALLTELRAWAKTDPEYGWIVDGPRVVAVAACDGVAKALDNWWEGRASAPAFHRRDDRAGKFHVRDVSVKRLNRSWGQVVIPKVGPVRFRITRDWSDIAAASSANVRLANGVWTISFTTPPPAKQTRPLPPDKVPVAPVGVDLGVTNTIATSTGGFAHMPGLTAGEQARFLALHQRLARQTRVAKTAGRPLGECRNRARTLNALARIRERLDARRTNFIEQTTTTLARTHDLIGIENLTVTNMVRRPAPKPDPDTVGVWLPNGAAAKRALNRAIHASRWGEFTERLTHKTDVVIAVPAAYSSQECSRCGHTEPGNRENQADFACHGCGHTAHADTDAAIVIRNRALAHHHQHHHQLVHASAPNPRTAGARPHQSTRKRGRGNPTGRTDAS